MTRERTTKRRWRRGTTEKSFARSPAPWGAAGLLSVQGSFPLDHFGDCKAEGRAYLQVHQEGRKHTRGRSSPPSLRRCPTSAPRSLPSPPHPSALAAVQCVRSSEGASETCKALAHTYLTCRMQQ